MRLFHARTSGVLLAVLAAAGAGCAQGRGAHAIRGENPPPLGVIEEPREGATALPSFKITGWAGDDRGIRAIRVFLDGELIALAEFAWERPDVSMIYPHFKHGTDRHGWQTTIEAAAGSHVVHVEAVDIDGSTSALGTRRIAVADPQL
jgi:hypothetical protein